MITDLAIADLLIKFYAWKGEANIFEAGAYTATGVCWASKRVDGVDVVMLRGSTTPTDWVRDFIALVSPFEHDDLGPVHPGFLIGMADVWRAIFKATTGPRIVAGHSLGAGRACILTGLMVKSGYPPIRRVCFGEPKPGFAQLASIISAVPAASYRNGDAHHHDIVTDVPITFPPEEYVHPLALTEVCAVPGSAGPQPEWGPLNWHHMPLYRAALAKVTPA